MNFYELIENRISVRNYDSSRKLESSVLERILTAGRYAPSAANRQPWKFVLISSEEILEKVYECYNRDWFKNAPHVLVVKGNIEDAWTKNDGYNSIETDLTIAMDHMILAAEYEGVSTCWIAAFDKEILMKAIGLKETESVFALTPLGYSDKSYIKLNNKSRKSLDEIVEYL